MAYQALAPLIFHVGSKVARGGGPGDEARAVYMKLVLQILDV